MIKSISLLSLVACLINSAPALAASTVIVGADITYDYSTDPKGVETATPFLGFRDSVYQTMGPTAFCYVGSASEVCALIKKDIKSLSAAYMTGGAEEDISFNTCAVVAKKGDVLEHVEANYHLASFHGAGEYDVKRDLFACSR